MMHPKAKAEKSCADGGKDNPLVANDGGAGKRGDDHGDQGHGGEKNNVDLRVAEQPEQMLPE